jgi:hypothetical protein
MNIVTRSFVIVARIVISASIVALFLIRVSAAVFNLDPSRSSISLSGSALGFPLQEQNAGSLTTTFSGAINVTVTDTNIAFPGSSIITAQNNGNWQPKAKGEPGSDPANFGGKASGGFLGSVVAAVRNAQFDATSSVLPMTATHFDSRSLLFQFLPNSAGALDYSVSGLLPVKGAIALAGLATNRVTAQATLATSGNIQTLTIPLTADFFFKLVSANDTTLTITGQIVATRLLGVPGLPRLSVTREADGKLAFSWPGSSTSFVLQQSPSIGSISGWSAVSANPTLELDRLVIRIRPDAQARFYRLSQP